MSTVWACASPTGCRQTEVIGEISGPTGSSGSGSTTASDPTETGPLPPDRPDLPPTEPEACGGIELRSAPDLDIRFATDSTWESGACLTVTVSNTAQADQFWWSILRFGGRVDTTWNATSEPLDDTTFEFRGDPENDNVALLGGEVTTFGVCLTCTPSS